MAIETPGVKTPRDGLREIYLSGTTVGASERVKLTIGHGAGMLFLRSAFSGGTVTAHTPKLYDAESGGNVVWEATWAGSAGLVGVWNAARPGMHVDTVGGDVWLQPSPDQADGTWSAKISFQVN